MKTQSFKFFAVFLFGLLLLALPASASSRITASITVTNKTTNGMTFTVIGDTRTFTNAPLNPATMVLTNADVTGCGSKTNLLQQIYLQPFALVTPADTGSNTFALTGNAGLALVVTASAGWASVSYSTQTVADVFVLQGPVPSLYNAQARTNVANAIVGGINAPEETNSINQNAQAASQLLGTNKDSTVSGKMTLNNTNNQIAGVISSLSISGNLNRTTNGTLIAPGLSSPVLTNAVNYGGAFSSRGTNGDSEQFGAGSIASGDGDLAIGLVALTSGDNSIAIGGSATALGDANISIGASATSGTTIGDDNGGNIAIGPSAYAIYGSIALGSSSIATNGSVALGNSAIATNLNSTALGNGAFTTSTNQVVLGSPVASVVVPNSLYVGNSQFIGQNLQLAGNFSVGGVQTNTFFSSMMGTVTYTAADIAFTRHAISSLANGVNRVVVGTNVFNEVSGPSGAFSVNGLTDGRDGKLIYVANQTGLQMTIANESGSETTVANRIRTLGSATDLVLTNSIVTLIYSAAASRWLVVSHNP